MMYLLGTKMIIYYWFKKNILWYVIILVIMYKKQMRIFFFGFLNIRNIRLLSNALIVNFLIYSYLL